MDTAKQTPRDLKRFDSSEPGLYLNAGWLRIATIAGPAVAVLVGVAMWFAARPSRDEVDKRVDAVKAEVKQDIQILRNEIRQDIQDLRVELRKLLQRGEKKP